MEISEGLIFVLYKINNTYGIMEFSFNDEELSFNDYYQNFTPDQNLRFLKTILIDNTINDVDDENFKPVK